MLRAHWRTLPLELQRIALKDALRASIEVGDFANAISRLNDFATIGMSAELAPLVSVLSGRLAEGVGRIQDALAAYRAPGESGNRPAAAQGRLRELALRYSIGDIDRADLIVELEILTTAWRGDETEVEAFNCWRDSTPRKTATAIPSKSCASRCARIRLGANARHPKRRREPSMRSSWPARATLCRRSMRSACSTIIVI
jgi:hypothetical protein